MDIRTVKSTRRKPFTPSGNPVIEVTFTDGSVLTTKNDTTFSFEAESREYEKAPHEVIIERGRLLNLRPIR